MLCCTEKTNPCRNTDAVSLTDRGYGVSGSSFPLLFAAGAGSEQERGIFEFGPSKINSSATNPTDGVGDFVRHVKVEIVCHEQRVEEMTGVPKTVVDTGLRGDGRIFASDVESVIPVEDGTEDDAVV